MYHTRETVEVHGSPPKNGGGSWITLEKQGRFMYHTRKTVEVHGSPPKNIGGTWIASRNGA